MSWIQIEYHCDECGVVISGDTSDIQEAPRLDCPECGNRMDLDYINE